MLCTERRRKAHKQHRRKGDDGTGLSNASPGGQ
jgi:hypothetical protein